MDSKWKKSGYELIEKDDVTIVYRSVTPINKDNIRGVVPPGVYRVEEDNFGRFNFHKRNIPTDKLQVFSTGLAHSILNEIRIFCESKVKYERMNQSYKRSFLLYGPPGTGKSSIIALAVKDLIEKYQAVVIQLSTVDYIPTICEAIENLRVNNPDQLIVLVFEDAERALNNEDLLSVLDGHNTIENLILLSTVNDIDCLPERIKNRPGRISSRYLIDSLDISIKKIYVQNFIKDLSLKDSFVDDLLPKIEDLSFDQVKEVLIKMSVFNHSIDDAIQDVTLIL